MLGRRRRAGAGCALAGAPVGARVRPVGVGGVGAGDRAARARHVQRAVLEAVPGHVHDAADALRGRCAPALWLVVARAGGLLALAGAFALGDAARRPLGGNRGGGGDGALAVVGCSTPRSATPRACWPPRSCGRSSRTSPAAAAGRARAADRGGADAPGGVAVPRRLRLLAGGASERAWVIGGGARTTLLCGSARTSWGRAARSTPQRRRAASRARAARSSGRHPRARAAAGTR